MNMVFDKIGEGGVLGKIPSSPLAQIWLRAWNQFFLDFLAGNFPLQTLTVATVGQTTINYKAAVSVMETAVVVAEAHAETVVAVVAEAEADIAENRGSGGGIDSDGSGNIGVGDGCGNGGWQWQQRRRLKQGQQWQRR